MPIRVLIADDDALIREGLQLILSLDAEFDVCGVVDNGEKAVEACRNNPEIDVALLDVRMPVMDGVTAATKILKDTTSKIIILTTFEESTTIKTAFKVGVHGYLLKNNTPDQIKAAIKMVYQGGSVMQDTVMNKLREEITLDPEPAQKELHNIKDFTEREVEILQYLAKGFSNKEIAKTLFITEGTVKNYISNMLSKTGLEHRTKLVLYYLNERNENG